MHAIKGKMRSILCLSGERTCAVDNYTSRGYLLKLDFLWFKLLSQSGNKGQDVDGVGVSHV